MYEEKWRELKNRKEITNKEQIKLPPAISYEFLTDSKHLGITLSRYKFVGKMLKPEMSVLEVGCGEGIKTYILADFVKKVIGIDFDQENILYANKFFQEIKFHENAKKIEYRCVDFLKMEPLDSKVDAVVSLDVIEHIDQKFETMFMEKICENLTSHGMCIIGTPNETASCYSSESSKMGHINLYTQNRLQELMDQYFHHSFAFVMNDELVHTGYYSMGHYLMIMGVEPKNDKFTYN